MARLLVHVEGQTEENFVNEALSPYLVAAGYHSVDARIVGNARQRSRRGGIIPWPSVRRDIVGHLREDSECIATTMVDFYGLPQNGAAAWPGRLNAIGPNVLKKAGQVEKALFEDVAVLMKADLRGRFIPFVVMHEFEGLLFSDCAAFSRAISRPNLEAKFTAVRNQFETPEDINDSPITAPSKRVEEPVAGYEKRFLGTLAALEIGLDRIRGECAHFDDWIKRLEALVQ